MPVECLRLVEAAGGIMEEAVEAVIMVVGEMAVVVAEITPR